MGRADEVELAAEKNLNTGQTSWHVHRRPELVPERCLVEGESGVDEFMPQAFRQPGHQNKVLHGNVSPFTMHNLDTGDTTVMEAEWAQYVREKKDASPKASSATGSPSCGHSQKIAGGSFWSAGQQQQALRILGKA